MCYYSSLHFIRLKSINPNFSHLLTYYCPPQECLSLTDGEWLSQYTCFLEYTVSIPKISVELSSSLRKFSSKQIKSFSKVKIDCVFPFFYHSDSERKQTSLMILILHKALLFFTPNPVLSWLLRNWFLVGLFVLQRDMLMDPHHTALSFLSFHEHGL